MFDIETARIPRPARSAFFGELTEADYLMLRRAPHRRRLRPSAAKV